ncbi:MAG TPA: hypothetical protein PLP05_04685, partial [Sedimentisphaerales bacterium]|nr:hypothetical protein [Sedimentisphaerales bacterium]
FLEKFISDLADPFGCAQGDKNPALTLWARIWGFGVRLCVRLLVLLVFRWLWQFFGYMSYMVFLAV